MQKINNFATREICQQVECQKQHFIGITFNFATNCSVTIKKKTEF